MFGDIPLRAFRVKLDSTQTSAAKKISASAEIYKGYSVGSKSTTYQ